MALPSVPGFFHRAGHELVTALHAAAPVLLVLGAAGVVGWLLWGRGLTGSRRAGWLGVPILALAAAFCVLGPGHLFPKQYEGPELLKVSASHALTALDVLGLLCAGGAAALGAPLAWRRVVAPGARRGSPPGGRT